MEQEGIRRSNWLHYVVQEKLKETRAKLSRCIRYLFIEYGPQLA